MPPYYYPPHPHPYMLPPMFEPFLRTEKPVEYTSDKNKPKAEK
jgi:hypothetical protein